MDTQEQDYLFELNGYVVLEQTVDRVDLAHMNGWIDAHWNQAERHESSEAIMNYRQHDENG